MVRLNFNDSALRHTAQTRPADREGRLLYRTSKDSYKERWFKLCGNLLFYFKTNDRGSAVDLSDPVGVLVFASCKVQLEEYGDRPFVFSVSFEGEDGRKHFFSGQTQQQCVEWVDALRHCGHAEMLAKMELLRQRVMQRTGKDPLELNRMAAMQRPRPAISSRTPASLLHVSAPVALDRLAKFYVENHSNRNAISSSADVVRPSRPPPPSRPAPSRPSNNIPLVSIVDSVSLPPDLAGNSQAARLTPAPPISVIPSSKAFQDWETFHE